MAISRARIRLSNATNRLVSPVKMPSKLWMQNWEEAIKYTPDAGIIQGWKSHLLFVYDDLMKGYPFHSLIEEFIAPVATGFTRENFVMYEKDFGSVRNIVPLREDRVLDIPEWQWENNRYEHITNLQMPTGAVKGELVAIKPNRIFYLDKMMENTIQYIRMRVTVQVPYRNVVWKKGNVKNEKDPLNSERGGVTVSQFYIKPVRAWMYVAMPRYWDSQMHLCNPSPLYNPAQRPFLRQYYFARKTHVGKRINSPAL